MRQRFWIGWAFLLGGLAAIVAAVAFEVYAASWAATADRVPGTVVDMRRTSDGSAAPVVRFSAGGRQVTWSGGVYASPPAYRVGEAVTMLVQRDDPDDAAIDGFFSRHLVTVVVGGIGSVFALVGGLVAYVGRVSPRRRATLLATGTPVQASIVAVRLDPQASEAMWRIHAQSLDPATQAVRAFHSEPLAFDPTPFLGTRREVQVFVDEARPTRYAMDLSWLPRSG